MRAMSSATDLQFFFDFLTVAEFFDFLLVAKRMPRSRLEDMGESGLQSYVSSRINVNVTVSDSGKQMTLFGCEGRSTKASNKLFLQEIEESVSAPLPPAASGRRTGQKRTGKGSAQVSDPSNLAGPNFQVPAAFYLNAIRKWQ